MNAMGNTCETSVMSWLNLNKEGASVSSCFKLLLHFLLDQEEPAC